MISHVYFYNIPHLPLFPPTQAHSHKEKIMTHWTKLALAVLFMNVMHKDMQPAFSC